MKKTVTKIMCTACCLLWSGTAFLYAQERATITGKVTSSEKGETLPGVTIQVKGTTRGASTDVDGNFSLQANQGDTLVVSYIGYASQFIAVGSQSSINVVLQPDTKLLDEVVAVGYGTVKKRDLTGSVASLNAKDLTQIASPDPLQMMQGRVAGVQIIANSGEPGGGVTVRVRGTGSINNSDPLYVIDGFQTTDASFVAPADIESIEILKDASATAIYGSRGANGVIIMTTKRGKVGKTQFTFDAYRGVSNMWKKIDMANATQYAKLYQQAAINDGTPLTGDIAQAMNYLASGNYKGTNWQDEISQTGVVQNYSLSANGGTENNKWSFSGTYYDQDGIIKNTGMKKYFARFTDDYKFNNWLSAGVSLNMMRYDISAAQGQQYTNPIVTALQASPITPGWDALLNNGVGNYGYTYTSTTVSPDRLADFQKYNKNAADYLTGIANIEAKIIKGLTLKSNFGLNYVSGETQTYIPTFDVGLQEVGKTSSFTDNRYVNTKWNWSTYLNYNTKIGDHSLDAIIGTEAVSTGTQGTTVFASGVPEAEGLRYVSNASAITSATGGASYSTILSYFARGNYNYKGRYFLTATVRADGSSKFTPDNRWGIFPAVGVGWNISEESFMKDISFISLLKVRGGWGSVGNQVSAGDYAPYTQVVGFNNYVFGGAQVNGYTVQTLGNANIKWENTQTIDAGIDLDLFNNRLSFAGDYFQRSTYNMIVQQPAPAYAGAQGGFANIGKMYNEGLELGLTYRNNDKAFKFDVSPNITYFLVANRVDDLGTASSFAGGSINRIVGDYTTITKVGLPMATFYGYQTDGIIHNQAELDAYKLEFPTTAAQLGDVRFVDQNHDGILDAKDKVNLGSPAPNFYFGFNTNMSYKNFDLRLSFQGTQGNKIVNGMTLFTHYSSGQFNSTADRLANAWSPENPNGTEARMTVTDPNNNYKNFSDLYVKDGSYIRLQNVTLGYTLPSTLVSKARLNSIRVYLAADNLLTLTAYNGFDPEISTKLNGSVNPFNLGVDLGNYPAARTFRAGLTVKF